jgi:catechol 2,3-dioxygenase-like lactoylglutathione lyase family enzyme
MKITNSATVFPVRDLDASLCFFTAVLGFREEFRFGLYAGIRRDECRIHLSQQSNPNTSQPGSAAIYVFCDEVDVYFAAITGRGAKVDAEPKDYDYGLRDFVIRDPDGNQLSFAAPIAELSHPEAGGTKG